MDLWLAFLAGTMLMFVMRRWTDLDASDLPLYVFATWGGAVVLTVLYVLVIGLGVLVK